MSKKFLLIFSVIFLTIGFASVSTVLLLNGNATLKSNASFEDYVQFESVSIENSDNEVTEAKISADGKSISFETTTMNGVGTTSIISYQIKNNSTYKADIEGVTCTEVDEKGEDVTNNGYVTIVPFDISGLIINKNESSPVETITVSQVKSYEGKEKTLHFKCKINARASEE